MIGPICTWDGFGFFSLKITVKQVQPPLVKMKKFGRTGQTSKEPFSRLEAGKKFSPLHSIALLTQDHDVVLIKYCFHP